MFDVNKEYECFSNNKWYSAKFIHKIFGCPNGFLFAVRFQEEREALVQVYSNGVYREQGEPIIREKRQRIWIGPLGQICGKEVAGWDCYEKVDT